MGGDFLPDRALRAHNGLVTALTGTSERAAGRVPGEPQQPEGRGARVVLRHDQASGLGAAVVVDDLTLGPGTGGVRWRAYRDERDAVAEGRRLARAMTLKNAFAELPCGGAKSVIFAPGPDTAGDRRRGVLEAFARLVDTLHGDYVPGLDMGTALPDLEVMAEVVPGICCLDPSPDTALGVYRGIAAAARHRWAGGLEGRVVLVQGTGHVGARLAAWLANGGASVVVADVDAARARRTAHEVGAGVVDPGAVLTFPCDVLAPCAGGRVIDASDVARLRCTVVAGAANDVLAHRGVAEQLRRRGIDYVPDFVINAGGVVRIHAARAGWTPEQLSDALAAIGHRVGDLLAAADAGGRTPLAVAEELASARLGRPVTVPD